MNALWEIVFSNALLVVVLATGVAVAGRFWKNPLGLHLLWLLVLLKFVTPPLMVIGLPLPVEPSTVVSDQPTSPSPGTEVTSPGEEVSSSNEMMPAAMDRQIGPLLSEETIARPAAGVNVPPQVAARERFPWLIVLTWIWCLGIVCTVLWQARRILRFQRLLRAAEPASSDLLQMAAEVGQQLGLRQVPPIRMLPVRISPLVWSPGFRPQLVLPMELFQRLEPAAQCSILAHELAHVRRKDHLARLLELLVSTLFWWHPVAWWACRELQQLEELCCDSMVVGMALSRRRAYVTALLDTLDFLCEGSIAAPLGATAAKSPILLARRIAMMKNRTGVMRLTFGRVALMVLLAAVPMGIAFAAKSLQSESEPNGPTEATEPMVATPQIAAAETAFSPDSATSHGNDHSGKTAAAKPADKVSPASDQSVTKEGIEKVTSVTWKNTVYERITSKDGKRTWLKSETRPNAYKAPGLYRETFLDEKGQVREVEITDGVHKKQLRFFPGTKEANLSEIATNWDPRGPFAWVKKQLEDTDLQWVETRKTPSGEANIFRHAYRDQANGRDWSYDFGIDHKTKHLVEIRSPGADIFDPDKDPARNTPPEKEWSIGTIAGTITHDIVFNTDLDDSLFRLEPPEGYTVKIHRRGQVTEKEMIDFLGLMADFNNKTFPDQPFISSDKMNKVWAKPKKDRTAAEQKLLETENYYKDKFQRHPIGLFIDDHAVKNSFRYLGKGVKLGDKSRIVCWYKLKGAKTYRAVYGDLSVRDVAPEDLPLPVQNGQTPTAKPADEVSPASDKSATKEGAKTESKPAPAHDLTAKQSADQVNVRESTITKNGSASDINSLFQEAGRLKPDDAESRNRIGIAMIKTGIGLPAIELLRDALQIKPDYAEAHNNLGYALLRPGMDPGKNRKEAIQHFEKALSLKPDYPEAHNNLGLALIAEYRASRAKEAIEHYQQALRFKPDDAEIHFNLGIAFSFLAQHEKTIEQLEQALRLRPAYPDAEFNLAVSLTKTGRLTEAIKHYRQAIQLRPDFFEAYDNMAEAYSRMNRASEAIEATQKALEIAKSGTAYSRLTKVLEARIEYYRAVQASWSK